MAKVNMLQLREDPPKAARLYYGVSVDGTEFYMTLEPGEAVCLACEGSGHDPDYEYRCRCCNGDGTINISEDE